MDGWMDGRTDGWMDGWTDGRMDGGCISGMDGGRISGREMHFWAFGGKNATLAIEAVATHAPPAAVPSPTPFKTPSPAAQTSCPARSPT
eukprot:358168-Chlamydomonas_euryale.AAC.1